MSRASLGYRVTATYRRECAPEGVRDNYHPIREGDDHGVPYHCDLCDGPLTPCRHEWGEWHKWFEGGVWRSCVRSGCAEIERADA